MVQNYGCSDEKNTTVIMQVIKRTADNINKVTKYQLKKEMHTTIWLGNEEPLQKFLQFSFLPRLQRLGSFLKTIYGLENELSVNG